MKMKTVCLCLIFCISRSLIVVSYNVWKPERYKLPDDLRYGVSTSAYQVEGAWDEDGKSESVWDRYLHTHPEDFAPGPNGDEACDSYHNLQRDVDMLRELGVDYYRFSISWARVLPTGFANKINYKGLKYYQKLTEELRKYKIESMATMYHNDLPQVLQDLGGWTNPNIVNWFEDYARVLYSHLPLVKYWIPVNQPSVCFEMYGGGKVPPGVDSKGIGDYKCVKNMLLAHARAYQVFKNEYKDQNLTTGLVGISLALNWADPLNFNMTEELNETAKIYRQFTIDMYLHPMFSKKGDFPPLVKEIVARNSRLEGLEESRLPALREDEIKMLKKSADFIGINHYTTYFVNKVKAGEKKIYPHLPIDVNVELSQGDGWQRSIVPWLRMAPYGIYRMCMYLNEKYNTPPLIITEYGWPLGPGRQDTERVFVMFEFLKAMVYALIDGSDLRGLTMWSLMDTIEWTAGSTRRFGLYEVDFESPEKTRSPRLSAHYFRNLIDTHLIIENFTLPTQDLSLSISPRKATVRPADEF